MSWARLDDNFHAHPKTYVAGLDGCGLFCKAISYAAHYLTDGFVPREWVASQVPARKGGDVVDRLVDAGMFEPVEGGFVIHGFLELNPTREQVLEERRKAQERMANRRGGSPEVRPNTRRTSPDRNGVS